MHPIDDYAMLQRRHEELRRQAEYERMARAADFKKRTNQQLPWNFANWLGVHMVKWGQKLEQFGTPKELQPSSTLHQKSNL